MARLPALLAALCLLPAIAAAAARPTRTPLTVTGKVYCDTCQAGFETPASTYIAGKPPSRRTHLRLMSSSASAFARFFFSFFPGGRRSVRSTVTVAAAFVVASWVFRLDLGWVWRGSGGWMLGSACTVAAFLRPWLCWVFDGCVVWLVECSGGQSRE